MLLQASAALLNHISVQPSQITMHYWYATHPQTPLTLVYDQSEYEGDQAYLTHLIETISKAAAKDFLRTADIAKCRFCVYRSHCDRGIEAGSLADFDQLDLEADDVSTLIDFDDLPEIEF